MVRFISKANQWIAINWTILFILASSVLSLWFLPLFDFRPYHIGAKHQRGDVYS
jgi:triosephosphate isomerase